MEENTTYSWTPQPPKKPKKPVDFKRAGKTLLAGWEGDRQKDFAEQNELNLKWFQEMASVTEVYITALNVAKAAYTALDIVQ